MYIATNDDEPGPSSRRRLASPPRPSSPPHPLPTCPGRQCPLLQPMSDALEGSLGPFTLIRRQDTSTASLPSSVSTSSQPPAQSPNSSTSSSSTTSPQTTTQTSTSTSSSPANDSSTSSRFSAPWRPSKSTSTSASQSTYVPGAMLPVNLAGDDDFQAVYSVPILFGHGPSDTRRASMSSTLNLQIDLGSSDIWLASSTCSSKDCAAAPALFDGSDSIDSGSSASMQYQSGSVSGDIYWEEMTLAGFQIPYQALILANSVSDEDLGGGNFSGILGLALPANSIILNKIPGSTSGNPDGATFLDNLFGAGASAPSQHLFSLALARREDVRTSSSFGIGTVSSDYCPSPCEPKYIPIVAQPSLGAVGFLHWRIPIQGISFTTWSSPKDGTGPTTQSLVLGPSQTDSQSLPLAVLDSGGVQILVGYQSFVDTIYSAIGVQASSDGVYRMPCTTQIALTFNFGGVEYPVHPLDLSWPDPSDPSLATCIGAIQYSDSVADSGDFILGSSFLKNVYTIFQYPDNNRTTTTTWHPSVGMLPLTNASQASRDFYAVRNLHQSLSTISANPNWTPGGSQAPQPSASEAMDTSSGNKILSTAGIAGVSVVGFFVVAAAAFCAWWFWLRRKFGPAGAVPEKPPSERSDSTAKSRTRKHTTTQRQKSMVEGYSDYEDSWMGTPEAANSIRMGFLPSVLKEDDGRLNGMRESPDGSRKDPNEGEEEPSQSEPRRRDRSPGTSDFSPTSQRYPYPRSASTSRAMSLSMSGPFPVANRASTFRPDSSPMYDIQASDYMEMGTPRGRNTRRASQREAESLVADPDPMSPTGAVFKDEPGHI